METHNFRTKEMYERALEDVYDGSALSLPVIIELDGQSTIGFFCYPSLGTITTSYIRPPYRRISVSTTNPPLLLYMDVKPTDFSLAIEPTEKLGSPKEYKWRDMPNIDIRQLIDELCTTTDSILEFYPLEFAFQSPAQRAAVRKYLEIFEGIAKIPLMPFYRAMNPKFFKWIESFDI